jgi:hypothetical protein
MQRTHFDEWLPRDRWFLEEEKRDSATLEAVRHAYELVGIRWRQGKGLAPHAERLSAAPLRSRRKSQ